ncbi:MULTISPECIES: hypothetical protein [Halomonas]|uniref:hypothetical protein n=1 Tax=Halomonas TaxID=2745 RepID=UPI0011B21DAF|nr:MULTISPECIES: hypothetical protein [Halomonas]
MQHEIQRPATKRLDHRKKDAEKQDNDKLGTEKQDTDKQAAKKMPKTLPPAPPMAYAKAFFYTTAATYMHISTMT